MRKVIIKTEEWYFHEWVVLPYLLPNGESCNDIFAICEHEDGGVEIFGHKEIIFKNKPSIPTHMIKGYV